MAAVKEHEVIEDAEGVRRLVQKDKVVIENKRKVSLWI